MDEVIFRSSQRFEDLQYHLGQAATDGKKALYAASIQSKNAFFSLLNKPSTVQLVEHLKELWLTLVQYTKDLNDNIVMQLSISRFYDNLIKLLSRKWFRKEMYYFCAGIVLGGYIGYVMGKSVSKYSTPVYYMQAIQCTHYSGIESVAVTEDAIAKHECGKNEVLISVKASSVHIIDTQISKGYGKTIRSLLTKYTSYSKRELPFTLGRDCTGIVTDIGKDVKRLEIGDEVWVSVPFWQQGTLSQTFMVSEYKVSQKPKKIGFESACSLPYAGTVALEALEQVNLNIENAYNKRIFVNGGCTPVGCILIQILKLWNAHITTTCFKRAIPVAKALGADDVITLPEPEDEDTVEHILRKEIELKERFDVVINTIKYEIDFYEYCISKNVVSTFPKQFKSDNYGFISKMFYGLYVNCKCITQSLFGYEIGNFGETHSCHETLDLLKKMVENNHLQTVVDKVFHPQEIASALYHIQSPASIGSTIISFR